MKSAIAILEHETNLDTAVTVQGGGPVLVSKTGKQADNYFTRRVEAALEADFAHGSMPA